MADIRIKDLATTATTTASDDFMAVDGATNGTRKMNAAAPAFLTSVTTPSLTSPASTNLTLAGGAGNSSIILTPAGTGGVGIGTITPLVKLDIVPAVTKTDTTSFGYGVLNLRTNETTNYSEIRVSFIGGATQASRGFQFQTGEAFVSNVGNILFQPYGGNVLIGTTDSTGLTGSGGLKINSSTAGASNAGALLITGGLSAGAASYFGGALTVNAGAAFNGDVTNSAFAGNYYGGTAAGAAGFTNSTTSAYMLAYGASNTTYPSQLQFNSNGLVALRINGTAATFAGAVTVGGNVGFYNNAPVAKPTGVAVTAAAIHAALVTLNLIAA